MAEKEKPNIIHVRSTLSDRRVLHWERDEAHPTGEIFIVNNGKVFEVAETAAIKRLLGEEKIQRVNWNSLTGDGSQETVPAQPPGRRPGRKVDSEPEGSFGSGGVRLKNETSDDELSEVPVKKVPRAGTEGLPKP